MNPLNFIERFFNARAFEREITILNAEITILKSENEKLKTENAQLKQEVKELRDRLEQQSKPSKSPRLKVIYDGPEANYGVPS